MLFSFGITERRCFENFDLSFTSLEAREARDMREVFSELIDFRTVRDQIDWTSSSVSLMVIMDFQVCCFIRLIDLIVEGFKTDPLYERESF